MAIGDEYYKEIKIGMILVLAFVILMLLGITKSFAFLGLNLVNIPNPLNWILVGLLGYIAYQIKMNY